MQFVHQISISSSPEVRTELADIGIVVGAKGFVSFEVDESQDLWPKVQQWIKARNPVDIVSTKFSGQEMANATWLELIPEWHHGYPQPNEDVFGYRAATFDVSKYCEDCGAGLKQRAPFQMKAEPKWGRNEILQLNWVFDEFFVAPALWRRAFQPHGVSHRGVLNTKGQLLKSVVQLVVEEEVDVQTDKLTAQKCGRCGHVKFVPVSRGSFPGLVRNPTGHIVKTAQVFGSGKSAGKRILVSRQLAKALEGVRGASMRPSEI